MKKNFEVGIRIFKNTFKALQSGSKKYLVSYFYSASGMEGRSDADEIEVFAESESEAIEKVILCEYPEDEFYGPHKAWSSRHFLRGCLSAKQIE